MFANSAIVVFGALQVNMLYLSYVKDNSDLLCCGWHTWAV